MSARLAGRHVVVTGAGSGIGRATAARLRGDGASVFGVDRAGAVELALDVTDSGASERIVAAALEAMGAVDGVVACAGISRAEPIEGHDDAFWDQVMAVNVTAVFRLIRAAVPSLKASGHGRIVTIGSVMASFGAPGLSAYAASKHAVLGMTRALASELGPHGITATCVQPGAIATPMTAPAFDANPDYAAFWRDKAALGRLGTAEDVADVIAFLLSDDARFVSGHGIFVDGGAMQQP
jgi:NAD(P)-dependent dehydrogenase (short-subunit alcohol dehydrogenase family)